MPALVKKPATTPIPVQLSDTEFHQFIFPVWPKYSNSSFHRRLRFTIARPLACLLLPSHSYSASKGIAKPEGETMDWKRARR